MIPNNKLENLEEICIQHRVSLFSIESSACNYFFVYTGNNVEEFEEMQSALAERERVC